jgi:phosphoglycolate phosphatase
VSATSPLRAILFDLDGTLVDSAADLADSLNIVLRRAGLRAVDLAETRMMIGDGALKLVERGLAATGGDAADGPRLLPQFLAEYAARATAQTRLYPGARRIIEDLRSRFRMAVVTNKPEAASRAILDALSMGSLIDVIIGGDTLAHRKPRPEPLLAALAQLDVGADEAVMVGDNHHDVEAAHAAGLPAILVTYGYCHAPPRSLGAEALIDSMSELPGAIDLIAARMAAVRPTA